MGLESQMKYSYLRVLIIGDVELADGGTVSSNLTGYVSQVSTFESVADVLAAIQFQPPHIIFFNISKMDFADYIALNHFNSIPTVLIADADDFDRISQCLLSGATDYLCKPFTEVMLRKRLDSLVLAHWSDGGWLSFFNNELASPLVSIQGFTELMLSGSDKVGTLTDMQARIIISIGANAARIRKLVTDVRDASQINSGKLGVWNEASSLPLILKDVLKEFNKPIVNKYHTLIIELPQDLPQINCSGYYLQRTLTALIDNAVKYTSENGELTISARVIVDRTTQQYVEISIADTGIGIDPSDQVRVFDFGFQSDSPQVREQYGNGMGLFIAKHFVEIQGGRIWFESEFGKGSTFHFTIPVADSAST
jgi:signal transduction histidine kinase